MFFLLGTAVNGPDIDYRKEDTMYYFLFNCRSVSNEGYKSSVIRAWLVVPTQEFTSTLICNSGEPMAVGIEKLWTPTRWTNGQVRGVCRLLLTKATEGL